MRYKKRWRIGLIVLIVGLLAFGTALVGLGASDRVGPINSPVDIDTGSGANEPTPAELEEYLKEYYDDPDFELPCELQTSKYDFGHPSELEEPLDGDCGWFRERDNGNVIFEAYVCFSDEKSDKPGDYLSVSFSQTSRTVYAFAIKYGGGTDTYYYPTGTTADGPLTVPGQQAISHITFYWCEPEGEEDLTVTKTVETSYIRTHDWEIDKSVETENEEFVNGTPKVWLYPDSSGDETATWEVCLTYLGFEDSDFIVFGEITIENTGDLDAVITDIEDRLAGDKIAIYFDDEYTDEYEGAPINLAKDATLTLYYREFVESKTTGFNAVVVTTEVREYDSGDVAIPDWGDPDEEIHASVEVTDTNAGFADKYGEVNLDADDYEVGDEVCFDYSEDFAWADYDDPDPASWEIDNTAEVIGDDDEVLDSADAKLKINWLDEELEVSKTVDTSYIRTHDWEIDKSVETENEEFVNGTPKIWLFTDGSGDETATWEVCVTYLGFEDSDFVVFGEITIENTGDLDADITNIVDTLAGDSIAIYYDDEYTYAYDPDADPIDLPKGETLTLYYREFVTEKIEGENEVTVTTSLERDYSSGDVAIPDWGDPDEEINATVNIKDISELFGEVDLGTVTAPNDAQFTYTKDFAFVDYDECGSFQYDNTAEIIGDDDEVLDSADATLKVNVQCYIYETAYAKSDDAICFIPTFSNWGWTNPIGPGTYNWDLWAGAGQCDTSKGTLVGSVTVVYDDDGYVNVTFNVDAPYILEETHVYAGTTMFPQMRQGRRGWVDTVAPGQYYNDSPFDGSEVYVIAHAVVGIPDPDFGPDPTE